MISWRCRKCQKLWRVTDLSDPLKLMQRDWNDLAFFDEVLEVTGPYHFHRECGGRVRPIKALKWHVRFCQEMMKFETNRELFDFVIQAQEPDGYDGCFSDRGNWEAQTALEYLELNLKEWLSR